MIDGWREIQNAGEDYLMLRTTTRTIVTTLKNKNTKTYKAMYKWCQENCEGSWGPDCNPKNDYYIVWRFWREHEAEAFQKKFKRFSKKNKD